MSRKRPVFLPVIPMPTVPGPVAPLPPGYDWTAPEGEDTPDVPGLPGGAPKPKATGALVPLLIAGAALLLILRSRT